MRTATVWNKSIFATWRLSVKLGICAELEREMQHVVDTYQDEWKTAVNDPQKRKQFRAFINSDAADPSVVMTSERGQPRPATWDEKVEIMTTLLPV